MSTCAHDGDKTLQHDETHHWYVCGKCGAELDRAEHSGGTATCTAPGNVEYWHCSVCNKNSSDSTGTEELTEITSPALNHTWGAWEKVSETQHQRICQNDGSHKETGDHTPGTAATCKAPANCSICGQPYGEKNPSNHTGGAEVRNQKEATTTTEGSVKIMLKGDLKAITDAGYTVEYKFYRYKARVMIYDKEGNFVAQTALKQCKYASRLWTK